MAEWMDHRGVDGRGGVGIGWLGLLARTSIMAGGRGGGGGGSGH